MPKLQDARQVSVEELVVHIENLLSDESRPPLLRRGSACLIRRRRGRGWDSGFYVWENRRDSQ